MDSSVHDLRADTSRCFVLRLEELGERIRWGLLNVVRVRFTLDDATQPLNNVSEVPKC